MAEQGNGAASARIADARTLRALAHPARIEIVDRLSTTGASVTATDRVRAEAHGRAFSLFGASVQAAGILGFFLAGPLVETFDPRVPVAGAGAAGLVAAFACLPLVRSRPRTDPVTSMRDEIGDNVAA